MSTLTWDVCRRTVAGIEGCWLAPPFDRPAIRQAVLQAVNQKDRLDTLERFPLDMGHYAYPACRK